MNKVVKRNKIGEKLHYYRKLKGLTQQEVAEKIGITRNAYAYYETKCEPSIDTLNKILEIFDVSFSEFMGEATPKKYVIPHERQFPYIVFLDHKKINYEPNQENSIDYNDYLSNDEQTLIALFRNLTDESKNAIISYLKAESES